MSVEEWGEDTCSVLGKPPELAGPKDDCPERLGNPGKEVGSCNCQDNPGNWQHVDMGGGKSPNK